MSNIHSTQKRISIFILIVFCLLLVLFYTIFYKNHYQPVTCLYPLRQLAMFHENIGWGLSCDNEVLFTENGIENFKPVKILENVDSSSDRFVSAAFIDEQTAYIAYFSFDTNQLLVEYTRNSGVDWQQTPIDFEPYADICDAGSIFLGFADEKQGYLLCCSTPALGQMTKLLFYTEDAGNTFSFTADLTDTIKGYPQGITSVSSEKLYVAVTYHGVDSYLYQSLDSAKTWESIELFSRTDDVRYVDGYAPIFYGEAMQKGIIILKIMREKAVYVLFTTEDAGIHWTSDDKIPCDSLQQYSITNTNQIYLIDQSGSLYRTCFQE